MMNQNETPRIGITVGDPAGIGPEIVRAALSDPRVQQACRPVVFGLYTPEEIASAGITMGKVSSQGGNAAYMAVEAAVRAAHNKEIDAIATGPLNKESLQAAGIPHIGHTEILASLTDTEDPLTLFETNSLRVFFLSRHVSLKKACDLVTEDRVFSYIVKCSKAMAQMNLSKTPHLAIAGLNPHCGEHGLFGDEERFIEKAILRAQKEGFLVSGPIGADSVFHQAKIGRYDAVLSLYHDQGHIACKTLDFEKTISITLGLPFLRTSVDHGTAFDIAGKGLASPVSMIEAILVAARYANIDRL